MLTLYEEQKNVEGAIKIYIEYTHICISLHTHNIVNFSQDSSN